MFERRRLNWKMAFSIYVFPSSMIVEVESSQSK
jgi:hypothetical protein